MTREPPITVEPVTTALSRWPLTARRALVDRLGRWCLDPVVGGVVLSGPAGVGKTRLAEELLLAAVDRPTARAIGHSATQPIPLGALAHLLPPGLTEQLGVGDDDRAALFHRARSALASMSADQRLLLHVDDIDQLDDTSLAALMPLVHERTIFLVATLRSGRALPSVIASLVKDDAVRLEVLPPLTEHEVSTLLHRVLDGPVATSTVERLAALSEGNLQVLRELVQRSMEQGTLLFHVGVWRLDGMPQATTLEELVAAQVADLDDDQGAVVELLAIAGVLGLVELESVGARSSLAELERRGLIRVIATERRVEVSLGHPLYGEIIRGRMSVLRGRDILRLLADRLERRGARRREDVTRLALWRLEAGGTIDTTLLLSAGQLALLGRSTRLAVRFARAAADQGRVYDAALIEIEAAILDGDHGAVERIMTSVGAASDVPDMHRAHLARRLSGARFWRGDLPGSLAALEAADRHLTEPAALASVRASRAVLLATHGKPAAALALLDELGDVLDPRVRIEVALAESVACLSVGRFADAIAAAQRGARTQSELPVWQARRGMAGHLLNEAHALGYGGRFAEARDLVESALVGAQASGALAATVWFEVVLGEIARDSGRGHDAIGHFRTATELAADAGQDAALVWAWVGVAQGQLLVGEADEAAVALAEADACSSPVATSWSTRERTRAWLIAAQGDRRGARRLLLDVASSARREGMWNFECGVVHDLVRFGDPGAALERLAELERIVEGPYVRAMAAHARAAVAQDPAAYDVAIEQFTAIDSLVLAAEAALEAADVHVAAGDRRGATALTRRAQRCIERAGGARTPPMLRASEVQPMSGREREVALLAAAGASSKDIADQLFVSKRTVDSHLNRIYRKLGIGGRDELPGALAGHSD